MNDIYNSTPPTPTGDLALQTVAMLKDTNSMGDISGGWILSLMDIAGSSTANRIASGRVAAVAVESMSFMHPVSVGNTICCYVNIETIGRSSININIEVWVRKHYENNQELLKVTEGAFVYVAIDNNGRTRPIPK
jgi:acyl-CoA thioesterase YciA